jgi:hypothetical protein
MSENEAPKPEEVLDEILSKLRSGSGEEISSAVARLSSLVFSSEAIRRELEILARKAGDEDIRKSALDALNLPSHRAVQRRVNANKVDRGIRYVILRELDEWVKSDLLDRRSADLIRRRYDFDFEAAPIQPAIPQAEEKVSEAGPAIPMERSEPEGPRPSLLQTLTSEAAIKIYLYLGAFFVIAAATLVGAAVPALRLPILVIGSLVFGGLSLAIKKRLPQPSFALFIVFSFLLLITANNLEDTLKDALHFSERVSAGYWTFVFFILAAVWSGSAWLYQSRFFSVTAFSSLMLAFLRIGGVFDAQPEFYASMAGVASLLGLGGVWMAKKWKDAKFALPLFIATVAAQGATLLASLSIFGIGAFDPAHPPLWHLAGFLTWGMACAFFVLSNALYPFYVFPWLAAGALIPMPWFFAAAFDLEAFGSTFVLFFWGAILAAASEILRRLEAPEKYSLPVLLASIPAFGLGTVTGFAHETWLGMTVSLAIGIAYAALHLLRARGWLWALALLNFAFAYFAFFDLETIARLDVFSGYQVAGAALLFLLPDLLLQKDWKANPAWRLPPRAYGALFAVYLSLTLLDQNQAGNVAVCYAVFALFFAAYALAYRNAWLGYLPAAYLPLAILFALDHFEVDVWLPALTGLAAIYFAAGVLLRAKERWSDTLRFSALALGSLVAITALFQIKETGGWYALAVGLLFAAEMYLRRNGWFEPGMPILFTVGALLILRDFDFERVTYHLLAYAPIWILADLLAHLTFHHRRPLDILVRGVGGLFAITSYGFLITESNSTFPAFGFGIYSLLFLTVSLLYRRPALFYAFTLTLPLFVVFLFRTFDVTQWIHPVIVVAVFYYAAGFFLRSTKRAEGWERSLLYSGLGVGVIVSMAAPILGGLDAALPVAIAATFWAVEAFAWRNAWLAFPANGLYLLSYFIILAELDVTEPQYYSIGAALPGLIQHYLLVRAQSKTGAFIMGMLSQFVLLGTTYIQMIETLGYFYLLFAQSLVMLIYGIVIRSRSMTLFPIGFVALGVFTAAFKLTGVGALFVIGCTGILLLGFGIAAVLLRERIAKLGERLGDWKP